MNLLQRFCFLPNYFDTCDDTQILAHVGARARVLSDRERGEVFAPRERHDASEAQSPATVSGRRPH